jgi:type II secretory pathway pseudopilin PulG
MKTRVATKAPTHTVCFNRRVWLLPDRPGAGRRAFTRIEAVAILATLGVLACLALPGLANNPARSHRALCVNNLRQIGQAFQTWATDHGERNPWWVPARMLPTASYDPNGGTRGHPLDSQLWFQVAWISNQLATPKVLACPSDPVVFAARDWSENSSSGFLHPARRNDALSYFLSLHAFNDYPQSFLAGDRNFRVEVIGGTCSSQVRNPATIVSPAKGWTASMHASTGNLLLSSGEVLQSSTAGAQAAVTNALPPLSESAIHALYPRPPYL